LSETLADPEVWPVALDTIRGLIEAMAVHDPDDGVRIDLNGAITAFVELARAETKTFIGSSSA